MQIQSTNHIPAISIEDVADQFQSWYKSKTNKFTPIPSNLKELIKQLFPHYSIKEILSYLSISRPTLLTIQKKEYENNLLNAPDTLKNNLEDQNITFIPLDSLKQNAGVGITTNAIHTADSYSSCQIIKPNGTKLIIQTSDPKAIIQAFLCCN